MAFTQSFPASSATFPTSSPTWYEAGGVWALADSERHLGHSFREGKLWLAYDAVHPNPSKDGFLCVGQFSSANAARSAIEGSLGVIGRGRGEVSAAAVS